MPDKMTPEQWIIEGEVGTSSRTIWAVMVGAVDGKRQCDNWHYDTPRDPDDFSRCYKLIVLFPEWKARLPEVAQTFPKWIPFIREWGTLADMYRKALARNPDGYGYSNEIYNFMQGLDAEGMRLDGWIQTSPGSWHRPDKKEQTNGK